MWWSHICEGWEAHILSLRSAWGVTTFWSLSVSSLSTGTFLVFFLGAVSRIPLAQLLFQIMVLLSEAFHSRGKGLYLSLKGRRTWFVSLNVVSGCHWLSKYHATLCPESVCYDLQIYKVVSHRRHQLMLPKYHRWATRYSQLKIAPTQLKKKKKKEDLTESTSVVPTKYPLNVKLELFTTLEC